jgi:hypothetical protein
MPVFIGSFLQQHLSSINPQGSLNSGLKETIITISRIKNNTQLVSFFGLSSISFFSVFLLKKDFL